MTKEQEHKTNMSKEHEHKTSADERQNFVATRMSLPLFMVSRKLQFDIVYTNLTRLTVFYFRQSSA